MTDPQPLTTQQHDKLTAAARRALDALTDLIRDSSDPGTEALAARFELEQALLADRTQFDASRAYEQRLREQHDHDVAELNRLRAELGRVETAMRQIRHLHKDSPMGPCPVCIDADAVVAGGDGLMPYPCPTGRLAGAEDCDPPSFRAAAEETHVVADDSSNPEHIDDCPGCETTTPDTLPAWLAQRFDPRGPAWDALGDDDRAYWEHQARAVRRAVARGGFKAAAARPAATTNQDGHQ